MFMWCAIPSIHFTALTECWWMLYSSLIVLINIHSTSYSNLRRIMSSVATGIEHRHPY